ncbi:MAG: outer membrane beta-barrel protein [Saprospiraceae bacterium]|nr:outer membrane beta-barrel protein [Saprospiraceae bacterium]
MKRIYSFLTFLLMLTAANVQGQLFLELDGTYLAPIALNQDNYGFSEMDYAYRSGYQGGLGIGYGFGLVHHVQVGIYYSAQGVDYANTFKEVLHEKSVKLDYLHIPVLYRLVSSDVSSGRIGTRFSLAVGPYFGILLNSNIDWALDGDAVSMAQFHMSQNRNPNIAEIKTMLGADGNPEDYSTLFESLDIGLTGSLGVRSYFTEELFLNAEVIAGFGFQDINSEPWRYDNSQGEYKKTQNLFGGIRIGLGYFFSGKE